MAVRYNYKQHGNEYGPVEVEVLQELARRGELSAADPVREENSDSWAPARSIAELEFQASRLHAPGQDGAGHPADRTGRNASGFGIASLVLGVLAILVCWIPIVNLLSILLGGIAILLALVGFGKSASKRVSVLGPSVGGGVLGILAMAIAIAVYWLVGSVLGGMQESNQAVVAIASIDPSVAGDVGLEDYQPATFGRPDYVDAAAYAVEQDSVRVRVVSVERVNVVADRDFQGELHYSWEERLVVRLRIENTSDVRVVNYHPWDSPVAIFSATLEDEHGNSYELRQNRDFDATEDLRIQPGKAVEERLYFHVPVASARELYLGLSSAAFGGSGRLTLGISSSQIRE